MLKNISEDTVTASILAEEIKRRGVNVRPFEVWKTSGGTKKPDLHIWNGGGRYVVESKFRKSEYLKAVTKIYDSYMKISDELGLAGGFAVLYPEQLGTIINRYTDPEQLQRHARQLNYTAIAIYSRTDQRNTEQFVGTLSQLSDWITTRINQPSKPIEPDIKFIIDVLRQGSINLKAALSGVSESSLADIFGGQSVFENILQYEEKKYPLEEMMHAAAYILINQIVFYHILSTYNSRLQELDEDRIQHPKDLSELYFKKVLDEVNYSIVFNYTIAPKIPRKSLDDLKGIIKVIKAISPEKVRHDILGTIFHDLIPLTIRKGVAAYYTNVLAAELLASLAIQFSSAKIADFASGSGGLLSAAYRVKRTFLNRHLTIEDHRRFLEHDLLGVDVMPFASHLTAINLSLQAPNYLTDKVNVAIWDSTFLEPNITIRSIAQLSEIYRRFAKTVTPGGKSFTLQSTMDSYSGTEETDNKKLAGPISFEGVGESITLQKYDVIIMNPPFTRQERLPENYKGILETRFSSYSKYSSGRMGYYGWFLLLSDKFLEDGGRIAFVMPATLLRVKSNHGLRELLSEKYTIEYVIVTWHRSAFSESTRFREMLFVARKGVGSDEKVSIVLLKRLPASLEAARNLSANISSVTLDECENEDFVLRKIDNSKFKSGISNWFVNVAFYDLRLPKLYEKLKISNKLISKKLDVIRFDLDKIKFGNFHGYIIYDRSRALKANDNWIVDKGNAETPNIQHRTKEIKVKHRVLPYTFKIPLSCLIRGLRRQSYVKTIDVTDNSDYLIAEPFASLKQIITYTPESVAKWSDNLIEEWRKIYPSRKSNLVVSRRFDISAKGTCCLSFFSEKSLVAAGTMWHVKGIYDKEYLKIIALWFNSTLNIIQILAVRRETRGAWIVLDNYMFEEGFLIPSLDSLSVDERNTLLQLYDRIRKNEFDSILHQLQNKDPIRQDIDRVFLSILGFSDEEISSLLEWLYDAVSREIVILKRLMGEGAEDKARQEEKFIDEYV